MKCAASRGRWASPATGQAAGAARTAIREAAKAKRAATAAEIAALKTEIERLRVAATGELQELSRGASVSRELCMRIAQAR